MKYFCIIELGYTDSSVDTVIILCIACNFSLSLFSKLQVIWSHEFMLHANDHKGESDVDP